ncbi:MAG TPA: hypothetical protein VF771_10350, partial [Longimicrobiaceae bacterium]
MPKPGTLEKATLTEMWPGSDNQLKEQNKDGGAAKKVTVQFNPQTLKVSFSNQNAGGNQPGGSATQFVGQGTTKLSLELWFDVTLPRPTGGSDPQGDVRNLTKEIAYFMTPQEVTKEGKKGLVPPGVQFHWGTFLFKGTVDSIEETLELFSEDGKPLRAGMQLTMSKQDLKFEFGKAGAGGAGGGSAGGLGPGAGPAAGTQPLQMASAGGTVQGLSAKAGVGDWKAVAISNGIENPRMVSPGALLNVSGSISAKGAATLGLTGATAVGVSARGGVSIGASTPAVSTTVSTTAAAGGITVAGSGSGSSGL